MAAAKNTTALLHMLLALFWSGGDCSTVARVAKPSVLPVPVAFLGSYVAHAEYSPLGPGFGPFPFHVGVTSDGGVVMQDALTGANVGNSSQAFYVYGTTLMYCGMLQGFFRANGSEVPGPIEWLFMADLSACGTDRMRWCAAYDGGCALAQWDMVVLDANTIDIMVQIFPPIVHTHLILKRVAGVQGIPEASPPQHCNFSQAGVSSPQSAQPKRAVGPGCPFHGRSPAPASLPSTRTGPFCLLLNQQLDYRLVWTMDIANQQLNVIVSANASADSWIAVGFGATFPGMNASDIVLAYGPNAGGPACIRTMFASQLYGPPDDDNTLVITNASLAYQQGRLSLSFTRALHTGHKDIPTNMPEPLPGFLVTWAIGNGPLNTCTDTPAYHSNTRGVFNVDFASPPLVPC
jgi:hypothetical protein